MRMRRIAIPLAGSLCVLSSAASGQVLRERLHGAPFAQLGGSVARVGDVDLDGVDDFAVGEPYFCLSSASYEGRVSVHSGATGALIRAHVGNPHETLGASVRGAGDVDGDGAADLVVGAPSKSSSNWFEEGMAVVYSGATGGVLWSVSGGDDFQSLGGSVDSAGDLDGDGRSEVLVGSSADYALVIDANGAVLHKLQGGLLFGYTVAGIDDVDSDLVPDFLISESWHDVSRSKPRRGRVWVHSGATATPLYQVVGSANNDYLGRTLSRLGDVNGDAIPDFIVASYVSSQGGPQSGLLQVVDGATGTTLHQLVGGAASAWLGLAVDDCADLDRDGVRDYVVGIPGVPGTGSNGRGQARVHSGASGALLHDFVGTVAGGGDNVALGMSAASGDWNGDGKPDFVLGDPLYHDTALDVPVGAAEVWLGCPASWANYGSGWPGTLGVPTLTAQSDPGIGTTCSLDLANSLGAATPGLLVIGLASASIPLRSGGTLLVAPANVLAVTVPAGGLVFTDSIPDDPLLCFLEVFVQGIELDPGAVGKLSLTPGLELEIGFDF